MRSRPRKKGMEVSLRPRGAAECSLQLCVSLACGRTSRMFLSGRSSEEPMEVKCTSPCNTAGLTLLSRRRRLPRRLRARASSRPARCPGTPAAWPGTWTSPGARWALWLRGSLLVRRHTWGGGRLIRGGHDLILTLHSDFPRRQVGCGWSLLEWIQQPEAVMGASAACFGSLSWRMASAAAARAIICCHPLPCRWS